MSWMIRLYETYENAVHNSELLNYPDPYFHIAEGCHIEITIDENGVFKSAQSLMIEKKYERKLYYEKTKTIIPITPKSLTGRTSGAAPYPLAEKIQYLAKDYLDYGGTKKSYFSQYLKELGGWANHEQFSHWKIRAVKKYVEKGSVIKDLVETGLLFVFFNDGEPKLITKWKEQAGSNEKKPALIQKVIGGEQGNAIIRWRVQKKGVPDDTTWDDEELIKSWQDYQTDIQEKNGFCQILGRKAFVTTTHPKAIYPQAVNSKLISTPTDKGYLTYLGRFTDESQPLGISFEVSQKSHNALKWLISRGQGKLIGGSSGKNKPGMVISWAISGNEVPQPTNGTLDFLWDEINDEIKTVINEESSVDNTINYGYGFANALKKYMDGYRAKLNDTDNIVIMGLDTATDGRMAITYYQEFFVNQYIDQISKWHEDFAWYQQLSKKRNVLCGAPSPMFIVETIFDHIIGDNTKDKLKKNAIERILPCIIEAKPFPKDLKDKIVQKVTNRNSYKDKEQWLWEKHLGIACSVYRGFRKRHSKKSQEYKMALDENNHSRDYLYGRLLAVAEKIEEMAMFIAKEKSRTTHASRLMQRFSDHPLSTWKTIEEGINPYQHRLRNNNPALENAYKQLLDNVSDAFEDDDFVLSDKLSGEYLLGYHSQRKWLRDHKLEKGKWVLKDFEESNELENIGDEK